MPPLAAIAPARNALLSVFSVRPTKIASGETYLRELSLQLNDAGWHHVICLLKEPNEVLREYLGGPNVSIDVLPDA